MVVPPTPIAWHIILAAGGGRRMGMPKGLLNFDGLPLLMHHLRSTAHLAIPRIVVTGARAAEHQALLASSDAAWVQNDHWASTWPADSLHLALRTLDLHGAGLVTPVDTPPVNARTLSLLLAAPRPAVPETPDGRPGHPVLLDAHTASVVKAQAPVGGLRSLLQHASRITCDDGRVALDFNHPAEWRHFTARS